MVAAGVVPIAHANDGGGSIRIPAAVNGLVGLKPTRDRLAQDATMRQMPVRIISDGVVTRSVRDTAAFFRETEKVYRALHLPPIGDLTRPGRRRLRIGVHTEGVGRGANAEVTELTLKVAAVLEELGHRVEHVDAPVAHVVPRRLPRLLVEPVAVPPHERASDARSVVGTREPRPHEPRAVRPCATQPAPDARRDPPAAPQQQGVGGVLQELGRGADADPGHRDPGDRLARPDPGLRAP